MSVAATKSASSPLPTAWNCSCSCRGRLMASHPTDAVEVLVFVENVIHTVCTELQALGGPSWPSWLPSTGSIAATVFGVDSAGDAASAEQRYNEIWETRAISLHLSSSACRGRDILASLRANSSLGLLPEDRLCVYLRPDAVLAADASYTKCV